MLFIWIARDKKEMFTQANPWNMNLDPLGTLRGNPNYCLSSSSSSMLRLLLHFRPRATKEVKENLTSIQRTRVMVISYQNIPRRTKRFEGAETRVWVSQVALVEKNPPAKAEDIRDESSSPGSGWSPGGGHGNALQYYFLENPMDRGAWQAAVHRVTQRYLVISRNIWWRTLNFWSKNMNMSPSHLPKIQQIVIHVEPKI